MTIGIKIVILYLLILNLAGFFSMGIDKRRAKKKRWRIPEKTLFLIAILGGSIGSILGMQVFRHKTLHRQFRIGMPVILIVQCLLAGLLLIRLHGKETDATGIAMGTVIQQSLYGADSRQAAEEIQQCLTALEKDELSWRSETSAVYRLNQSLAQGEPAALDQQEAAWLRTAWELCRDSDGVLDITLHPVIELWGIEGEDPAVPDADALEAALSQTGYEKLYISDADEVTGADTSVSIDLGAVGKGIAADEVREYLETQRIVGGVVSIGGSILVYGDKPDGGAWQIGIRDPAGGETSALGTLSLTEDCVVSTSGDYEKYFIEDGVRYHHIFDPETGAPADSGLTSVTVVCESGLISDGLSTACFVMGYADSLPLLEAYQAEAVFVTTDGTVYVTEGLTDAFTLTNDAYTYGT